MFLDFIALLLLMVALFKGLRNGLVVALFSFLAFLIGLAAALKLSALAAGYIGQAFSVPERWLPFLAFAAVFIIVVLLVRLGAKAVEGVLKVAMLGWLNRLGGVIFYGLLYGFIFSIFLFYAAQMQLIKADTLNRSVSYSYLQPLAPQLTRVMGMIVPFFQNVFADLELFFEGLSKSAA